MYDSCDIIPTSLLGPGDEARPWDPWIWYRHCLSTPHIEYLIVHRLRYVLSIFEPAFFTILPEMMNIIIKNEIPLHINSSNWFIREFITDVCAGKFQIEYKDFS